MKKQEFKIIILHRGKIREEVGTDLETPLFESVYQDKDKVWSVRFMSKKPLPKTIKIDVRNHK